MSAEQLQTFFESLTGQIVTLGTILLLFLLVLISGKDKKPDAQALVLSAIFAALFLVLDQIILFRMPQGGSITAFSMLAITACAYLLGTRRAVMAGMCAGLASLIFNPYVIHPIQLLLDYPLAAGALGFAGLAGNKKFSLPTGYLIGVTGRYLCAFLSGMVFFGQYAPSGFNAFSWSLYYNLSYIGPEAAGTFIILLLPPFRRLFEHLKKQLY